MTEQFPSAPGSPEHAPWGQPTPYQRPDSDATVHQTGGAHDPWNRDSVTTPAPGPGYQPYPQPTAYEQQPYNAPAGGAPHPFYAAQPGGYPQPTAYDPAGGYGSPEQTSGYSTLGTAEPAPKRRGRRRTLFVSASVVVMLLLGVGAYAAVRIWTGSGNAEPETAMPASVGAFARVDLNPGVRDKLAVDNLVKKFPTHAGSTSDLITQLETNVARSLGLDYTTDVKPWFDGRIGVAEWTDHAGKPVALLDFAAKDEAAARTALAKVAAKEGADNFGYVVQNGYVLVAGAQSGAQADATAAAAAAKTSSLADSAQFKSAAGHLNGNNLVVVYADLHELGTLLGAEVEQVGGDGTQGGALSPLTGLMGLTGGAGGNPFSKLSGTVIIGAAVVDDGIEIRAHAEGSTVLAGNGSATTDARAALDALPETTILGLAFNGLDPNGATASSLTQMLNGLLNGELGNQLGGSGQDSQALVQAATTLLTSKVITIALTGLSGGMPSLLVSADTRDADGAAAIKATIDQLLGGASVPGLEVTQDGSHVQATFGNAGSGHLGDDSLYKETMSGMNNVQQAAYLNVQELLGAVGQSGGMPSSELAAIAPIKSLGLGASSSGSGSDLLLRIVIK